MKIYRAKNYDHMSQIVANILAAQITLKSDSVLGLATGGSPVGAYKRLIEKYKNGDLCFDQVRAINLDEYCGVGADDEQSYAYFMRENLFNHVNINLNNVYIPNGLEADAEKECKLYDAVIAANPIDMQLLGVGTNGHIGFNEPSTELMFATHHAALAEATIEANRRYFESEEQVPKTAYTMGVGQIMHAKKILLIASGESKANILYEALCGPITTQVPASFLQMHRDVTVVGDEAALARLR